MSASRAEQAQGLVDVPRPGQRVADLRAAQGVHVVQGVRGDLRHAQGAALRQVEAQLGGRLGPRRVLEDDAQPVDGQLLAGLGDDVRRRDQAHRARRGELREAGADALERAPARQVAVHVGSPTGHHVAREDVLADRLLEEVERRNDPHPARGEILVTDHGAHPAEVVHVAVGMDDSDDREVGDMLADHVHRGPHRLDRDEGVDHDPAVIRAQEAHDREVEPSGLVDAVGDLEDAGDRVELALTPEARVGAGRRVAVEEAPAIEIPRDVAGVGHDLPRGLDDQAAPCVLEVGDIVEGKIRERRRVDPRRLDGRRLGIRHGLTPPVSGRATARAMKSTSPPDYPHPRLEAERARRTDDLRSW